MRLGTQPQHTPPTNKSIWHYTLLATIIIGLISIAFNHVIPLTISKFEFRDCAAFQAAGEPCGNPNLFMSAVSFLVTFMAIFGTVFALGAVLAVIHRRLRPDVKELFLSLGTGFLAYFFILAIDEVLWLEPWKERILPDGIRYNAYTLNAIYTTPIVLVMMLGGLLAYLATYGLMAGYRKLVAPRPKPAA